MRMGEAFSMTPTFAITILVISLIFQMGAAILSLRLIAVTGSRSAWLVISLALVVMALRRVYLLIQFLNGEASIAPHFENELFGLSIAILLFCGLAYVGPLFQSVRDSASAIMESEQRFSVLVETSPLYYIAVDGSGNLLSVNPALLEATGHESHEVLGKRYLEVFVPESDREWLDAKFADLLRQERPVLREARVKTKSGHVRLVEYHGRSIFNDDGSLRFLFAFGIDMTERIQADRALRESESRFRAVIENTRDLIFKFNLPTMSYEYMSPSAEAVTGFTTEELIDMGPYGIMAQVHPDDRVQLREHFKKMLGAGPRAQHSPPLLYRWKLPSGDFRWLSEYRKLVFNGQEEPAAIVGSTRDETERIDAEQGRERLQTYLQDIIDNMPAVVIGMDSAGAVTLWNREAERFTGFNVDAALARSYLEVIPLLAEHAKVIDHVLESGEQVESLRFSAQQRDGEMHHYDLMVYPVTAKALSGAVVRLDDVTNRVQFEEVMVQTEKMMSVGGLAAGMAHEINNPLGGILQACQNIDRRTSPDLKKNHEVAESLGTSMDVIRGYLEARGVLEFICGIRADGSRAAKIVSDMLAYSRRGGSKFANVQADELVETVLRLASNDYDLKKQYDFRKVIIEKDLDPDTGEVWCEKTKIEQVLLNLVKNASQALGASPDIKDPRIVIRCRRGKKYIHFEVVDNGPGMDEQTRRRVFEPFFTTKEVGLGTGLGLSVSYFIISKQHHGTMSVESAPGKGARFLIKLPIKNGAEPDGHDSDS